MITVIAPNPLFPAMIPYGNMKTVSTQTRTDLKLIWESGPLTKRDLNIPSGNNTNVTGSMLFKKGKLENIDQRSYFREVLFKDLDWSKDHREGKRHIERVSANFTMVINGKYCGEWSLVVSHNTKNDIPAYVQHNSMTKLSWGHAIKFIADPKLIGASLKLFKGKGGRLVFIISIP
jgi:hypothetical protein